MKTRVKTLLKSMLIFVSIWGLGTCLARYIWEYTSSTSALPCIVTMSFSLMAIVLGSYSAKSDYRAMCIVYSLISFFVAIVFIENIPSHYMIKNKGLISALIHQEPIMSGNIAGTVIGLVAVLLLRESKTSVASVSLEQKENRINN